MVGPEASKKAFDTHAEWMRCVHGKRVSPAHDPWLFRFRIRAFSFILFVALASMAVMVTRGFLIGGPRPWADLIIVIFLVLVRVLVARKPTWLPWVAWAVLAAFFVGVFDGLFPVGTPPITPTHVLLPLLVLYGALLGYLSMSLTAMCVSLIIYSWTAIRFAPLSRTDLLILTNLVIACVGSALAALGVWIQHKRLLDALREQAEDLQRELEAKLRLNAVIFHDIRNPLGALRGVMELVGLKDEVKPHDLSIVDRMAGRINAIIDSVRQLDADSGGNIERCPVTIRELHDGLCDMLGYRLDEKNQRLTLSGGGELIVLTNPQILCNSVLSNVLTNAIKFSPRGAEIEMFARPIEEKIAIEIRDSGPGFPEDVMDRIIDGKGSQSTLGTEGESGTGYGLRIAMLYLKCLRGHLKVHNEDSGGVVTLILPPVGSVDSNGY